VLQCNGLNACFSPTCRFNENDPAIVRLLRSLAPISWQLSPSLSINNAGATEKELDRRLNRSTIRSDVGHILSMSQTPAAGRSYAFVMIDILVQTH